MSGGTASWSIRSLISGRQRILLAAAVLFIAVPTQHCAAQLCGQLSGFSFSENFNNMATTGSNNSKSSLPSEFSFVEDGSSGNLTYSADTGAGSAAETYSYGSTGSSDRALGEITSGTVQSTIGACFVNNTNHAITSLVIGYAGEQWRRGQNGGPVDKLDFQYSTNSSSLTSGTYIDVDDLDFTSLTTATLGAKNGNNAANRTVFPPTAVTPSAPIQPEATFYIRWVPLNISGANDGLAIDDFSIGAVLSPGIAGDYSNNGKVDAADYIVWRNSLNQAVTIPNDITPGTVTAQDFIEWKDRFNRTNANLGAAAAVPEPTNLVSALMLVVALAGVTALPRLARAMGTQRA
jgi:hypothetical protein